MKEQALKELQTIINMISLLKGLTILESSKLRDLFNSVHTYIEASIEPEKKKTEE